MSDIRFNRWLHQSGTGGISQDATGNIGIGTTVPTMALDIRGDVNIGDTININNASGIISATTFTGTTGTFSGNVSAVDATFTGNVSIAGTLTYEDVSNIDAVGIITAQSDIIVGGGLTVTGISTFNNDVKLLDNDKLKFGIGEDLQIYQSSSASNIKSDLLILRSKQGLGDPYITCTQGGSVALRYSGTPRFETTTTGAIVSGILTATTFSGNLTGNVTGNVTGDLTGNLAGISSIASISSSISDTAVDVFVYDASKDSDGGAWRKRTQHTSWYNETLGTATRGNRKEFPAVAVIVTENAQVTIYDGDDPDLPMWMVFNAGSGNLLGYTGSAKSTVMLNGKLANAAGGANQRFRTIDFISDFHVEYASTDGRTNFGINISQRNSGSGSYNYGNVSGNGLIDRNCNDVAMTVLPNAPVDSATGLPIPTIAVATNGGMSVIKDDGTVVDMYVSGESDQCLMVNFTDSNDLAVRIHNGWLPYYSIPSADATQSYWNGVSGYKGRWTDTTRDWGTGTNGIPVNVGANGITELLEDKAIGHTNGLEILQTDLSSFGNGMHAGIATNFNTGYQHGDIKGAFLSDTSTTNAAVAYSDGFSNNNKGWAFADNGSSTISGGNLVLEQNNNARGTDVDALNGVATGTKLVFTGTVSGSGTGTFVIDDDGAGAGVGGVTIYGSVTSTGSFNFTATKTASNRIRLLRTSGSNNYDINFINITTEYDRSVNAKGLSVYGTVTKSVVATGAELVAYSGFSATNYLKQQYNSDLAPGTAAYSVSCWFKTGTSSGDQYIFDRNGGGAGSRNLLLIMNTSAGNANKFQFWHRDNNGNVTDIQITDKTITDNVWHQVVALNDGSNYRVYVDGEVSSVTSSQIRNVISDNNPPMFVGIRHTEGSTFMRGSMALFRYSKSAPSPEQIKKIYEDEKCLFHENAKATLYGSSDAVTGLAFDDTTNLLHVGTSAGRSEFQGLRRINNTTDAVTTAISASNGIVAEQ